MQKNGLGGMPWTIDYRLQNEVYCGGHVALQGMFAVLYSEYGHNVIVLYFKDINEV